VATKEHREVITKLQEMVKERNNAGAFDDIENMTIKEIRMKAFPSALKLNTNEEKASIASVIAWIITAGRGPEVGER
jgi:hypothetical protein